MHELSEIPSAIRLEEGYMKFHLNKEVLSAIGDGHTLSSSLRLSKFVKTGDRADSKAEVDWVCKGQMGAPPFSLSEIPGTETLRMKTKARLIINQSGGILENANLALHRHFSCPYIPGSAVKGVARHAAWCEWKDCDEEEQEVNARILAEVFGNPTGDEELDKVLSEKYMVDEHSGKVSFLPAFPVSHFKLETDILNSHEGKNPVPVFFPAVAPGSVFEFATKPLKRGSIFSLEELSMFATGYLKDGLEHYGIGAKTAAGYGWFEEVQE